MESEGGSDSSTSRSPVTLDEVPMPPRVLACVDEPKNAMCGETQTNMLAPTHCNLTHSLHARSQSRSVTMQGNSLATLSARIVVF